MRHDIKAPSAGESATQADIEKWERKTGDFVKKGEALTLLETDKASLEIAAPASGALTIVKEKGQVSAGDLIAFIEEAKGAAPAGPPPAPQAPPPPRPPAAGTINPDEGLSPAVRRLLGESRLSPPYGIPGTGKGGRLTKEDVLKALKEGGASAPEAAPPSSPPQSSAALKEGPKPGAYEPAPQNHSRKACFFAADKRHPQHF